MSQTDYSERLDTIVQQLEGINPDRVVTRTFQDFTQRREEDLEKGIFTVISAGVTDYPGEYDPGDDGRQRVLIIFQGRVAESADGPALEAAEFAAMNELERLAQEHSPEILPALILKSAETSMQLEHPYCWVRSEWENWTDPDL